MNDLVASSSPRALLVFTQRWLASVGGVLPLGPSVLAVGEVAVGISSREASAISASSGYSPGMMCPLAWRSLSVCGVEV